MKKAKDNIKYRSYNQSSSFLEKYYEENRMENLVGNLIEYERIKEHEKGALCLSNLLNKQNSKTKNSKPAR